MKSHWKFWWQYTRQKHDKKYNLWCCVKDGIKGSEYRARKEENELKWWLKNEYFLYLSSYLQRYLIQSSTTTSQLLTLKKHCYLSPPHITLITASPIDGKDPSHDSFKWTFCPLPDKHQIIRHLCLLDHMNRKSCYRVDTCLASCFVGFLLTWQRRDLSQKHWEASVLCVHSTVLKSPVPASKSLTAARTNCLVNESTKAKEKRNQTTYSFFWKYSVFGTYFITHKSFYYSVISIPTIYKIPQGKKMNQI